MCFDAKECHTDTFPLQNIHAHQISFMGQFERQDGIAFLIVFYSHRNEFYYLRYQKLMEFWDRSIGGGRKSFRYEELEPDFFISPKGGLLVPYLDLLKQDLEKRG